MRKALCFRQVHRPYRILLDSMELGSRGLLMAADIFEQFKKVFCERHSKVSLRFAASSELENIGLFSTPEIFRRQNAFLQPIDTLRAFCGQECDIQPFTILLMKALCDLGRIEDLRFLFAVYVKELLRDGEMNASRVRYSLSSMKGNENFYRCHEGEGTPLSLCSSADSFHNSWASPTVELFNVYLYAISLTDTFNLYEIQNVERLMKAHGVSPDIVTKLSFFILFLRLGEVRADQQEVIQLILGVSNTRAEDFSSLHLNDSFATSSPNTPLAVSIWPVLRKEIEKVITEGQEEEHPMLFSRLGHCFQVLFRLYHDVPLVKECYDLIRKVCPERLSTEQLITYMVLTIANRGTPPRTAVEMLQHLEERRELSLSMTTKKSHSVPITGEDERLCSIPSSSTCSTFSLPTTTCTSTSLPASLPPLHSEVTILRLLTKCARHGDVASLEYVLSYLERHNLYRNPVSQHLHSVSGVAFSSSCPLRTTITAATEIGSTVSTRVCTSIGSSSSSSSNRTSGSDTGCIQKENLPVVTLLQIQAYARANKPLTALWIAESASCVFPPSSPCWLPGGDVIIHLTKKPYTERRVARLAQSTDPMTDLLSSLTRNGTKWLKGYIDSLGLFSTSSVASSRGGPHGTEDQEEKQHDLLMNSGGARKVYPPSGYGETAPSGGSFSTLFRPTGMTLQFLLAAAAQLKEMGLTSSLLQAYTQRKLGIPSSLALSYYVRAPLPHYPSIGVARVHETLRWMNTREWNSRDGASSLSSSTTVSSGTRPLEPILLSACMDAALAAGDVPLALQLCDAAGPEGSLILSKAGPLLFRLAAATGDSFLIRACQRKAL